MRHILMCLSDPKMDPYPRRGETDVYVNHHGPYAICEKFGFTLHKDMERDSVVRKYFQEGPL